MVNQHFMFMKMIDVLEIHTRNIPEQQNDLLATIVIRFLAGNITHHPRTSPYHQFFPLEADYPPLQSLEGLPHPHILITMGQNSSLERKITLIWMCLNKQMIIILRLGLNVAAPPALSNESIDIT
jgi:hypothetical protein